MWKEIKKKINIRLKKTFSRKEKIYTDSLLEVGKGEGKLRMSFWFLMTGDNGVAEDTNGVDKEESGGVSKAERLV